MDRSTLTSDEAATYTWYAVSLEHDPKASHGLSADVVATDEHGHDIVSVIHVEDRRHWNLTCVPGHAAASATYIGYDHLAETLLATNSDTTISVIHPQGDWQLDVTVLEKV